MSLDPVSVIVARSIKTHLGGADYAEVETAIAGSPFSALVYRAAQNTVQRDEAAPGTATLDEMQRLSVLDPACPIQVGDIAFFPLPLPAGAGGVSDADPLSGRFTRAKVVRVRRYGDRCQYDLETGAEGDLPAAIKKALVDAAEQSSAEAADRVAARDIAEQGGAEVRDTALGAGQSVVAALVKTKRVFAHYMVANRSFGGSVAGYERDITDAQAMGVDGFSLNCGAWNASNYKADCASIFTAAENVYAADPSKPRFLLFFSADMSGNFPYGDIVQAVTTLAVRPNYYHKAVANSSGGVDLRPMLTTYGGEGGSPAEVQARWNTSVLNPLRAAGINVFFVPRFFVTWNAGAVASLAAGFIDGAFVQGPLGNVPNTGDTADVVNGMTPQLAALKAGGFYTQGSVLPQYWGSKQTTNGRAYYEFQGSLGLYLQFLALIGNTNCDDLVLFTWNDFDEATWFSPIDDPVKYWPYLLNTILSFYKTRNGLRAEVPFFIAGFKAGALPTITQDMAAAYHRIMPNSLHLADPEGAVYSGPQTNPATTAPDALDEVFLTTQLVAPATAVYTGSAGVQTVPIAAGLRHTAFPFVPGPHSLVLQRNGVPFLLLTLEPIVNTATPPLYNFNYSSRVATASYNA